MRLALDAPDTHRTLRTEEHSRRHQDAGDLRDGKGESPTSITSATGVSLGRATDENRIVSACCHGVARSRSRMFPLSLSTPMMAAVLIQRQTGPPPLCASSSARPAVAVHGPDKPLSEITHQRVSRRLAPVVAPACRLRGCATCIRPITAGSCRSRPRRARTFGLITRSRRFARVTNTASSTTP